MDITELCGTLIIETYQPRQKLFDFRGTGEHEWLEIVSGCYSIRVKVTMMLPIA
jgi:hypothetical protein